MSPAVPRRSNKNNKRSRATEQQKPAKKPRIAVDSDEEEEGTLHSESDDELDQLDSSEKEEDDNSSIDDSESDLSDNEESETKNKGKNGSQTSNSNNHSEQKRILKERKLHRKSGEKIQQIKALWEKLRVKNPPLPKKTRDKLCDEIWELSKDHIANLILKHDASRVVQTLVKYSSKERRHKIVIALKGKFYVLATSSYGKYLLVKLLHYGTRDSRQIIIDELHGSLRKLMRHKEGAYVIEDMYVLYATQEQRQQMIREFWGSEYALFRNENKDVKIEDVCASSVEKRNIIARNLLGTITASVEKGSTGFQILHAAMRELVHIANDQEITDMLDLLHEQFAELVHTPEGSEVACTLIARANAKERKQIVRALKEHGEQLIKNEYGNLVFTTLLMCTDDTVLIFKSFNPIIKESFAEFISDKYGRRPFLYILLGVNGKYFSPIIKKDLEKYYGMASKTSKKDPLVRRKELLAKFSKTFLDSIDQNYSTILSENLGCQFVSELLTNDEFYEQLDSDGVAKYNSILNSIKVFFKGDISEEDHPIHTPFAARLLKSLISGGKWNNETKSIEPFEHIKGLGDTFAIAFYNDIIDSSNLVTWINDPDSSFTIVSLFESLRERDNGESFIKDLKAIKSEIVSGDSANKGAQLLLKLMDS